MKAFSDLWKTRWKHDSDYLFMLDTDPPAVAARLRAYADGLSEEQA